MPSFEHRSYRRGASGARAAIVLLVLTLIVSALAGPAAAQATTTLRFWHANAGPLGEALAEEVQRFNDAHPGIVVVPEFVGDYTALHQKIMAAVAAGDPPELAQAGSPGYVQAYLEAGVVVPVERFLDGPDGLSEAERADLVPGLVELASFDVDGRRTLVSWPFNPSLAVLYYNTEMLEEAGVAVPQTWDDFREAARRLTVPGSRWGVAWSPGPDLFVVLLRAYGGELLDPSGRRVAFDGPEGVQALTFLADLFQEDGSGLLTRGFDWQNELINERAGLAVSSVVSRVYIERDLGDRFHLGMAPLPRAERASTTLYGSTVVVFQTRPELEQAAWTFLKWWAEPDQTARWSLASGYMPVRLSASGSPVMQQAFAADPRLRVGLDSLAFARPDPNLAAWGEIRRFLTDAVTLAVTGRATPQQALQQAAAQANRAIEMGM